MQLRQSKFVERGRYTTFTYSHLDSAPFSYSFADKTDHFDTRSIRMVGLYLAQCCFSRDYNIIYKQILNYYTVCDLDLKGVYS